VQSDGDWNRTKLAEIFGGREAQRIFNAVDREAAFQDSYRKLVENSQTAQRLQGAKMVDSRSVLKSLGTSPDKLLTPEERERVFTEELERRGYNPAPAPDGDRTLVNTWLEDRGLSQDDSRAMAEIIASENWKDVPGENTLRTLERARKALARSNSRKTAHKAAGDALDSTLRTMARRNTAVLLMFARVQNIYPSNPSSSVERGSELLAVVKAAEGCQPKH
jgi:hypothetical protein